MYRIQADSAVIGVDAIRQLCAHLHLSPQISMHKIAIIDGAHNMNGPAANALLKILEEPPGQTLIFLITHQPYGLLATIRSRCQRLSVPMPSQASLLEVCQDTAQIQHMPLQLQLKLDKTLQERLGAQMCQALAQPVTLPEMTEQECFVLVKALQWVLLDTLKFKLNLSKNADTMPFFQDIIDNLSQFTVEKIQSAYDELLQLQRRDALALSQLRLKLFAYLTHCMETLLSIDVKDKILCL